MSRGCIELRGLANRSEGLGGPCPVEGLGGRAGLEPVDKSEGFGAGLAWALSIKVRGLGQAGLGPVDKSEGLGAGPAWALSIKVRGWGPGRPGWAGPKVPLIDGALTTPMASVTVRMGGSQVIGGSTQMLR